MHQFHHLAARLVVEKEIIIGILHSPGIVFHSSESGVDLIVGQPLLMTHHHGRGKIAETDGGVGGVIAVGRIYNVATVIAVYPLVGSHKLQEGSLLSDGILAVDSLDSPVSLHHAALNLFRSVELRVRFDSYILAILRKDRLLLDLFGSEDPASRANQKQRRGKRRHAS